MLAVTCLLLFSIGREANRLALFYLLLLAVPAMRAEVPGVAGIRYFFALDYIRLLTLAVLLPTFLSLRGQPGVPPFGRLLTDKFVAGYILLVFCLTLSASTFTHSLRSGLFYGFIDIFLPYYVASRALKDEKAFRDTLSAFVIAGLIASAIGAFEFARHWLLYASLDKALGVNWEYGMYLERTEGALRAQATAGHAIPLGYSIAVALGFFLMLIKQTQRATAWVPCLLLLLAGLLAPVSRGPWVGAVTILLVFYFTGEAPFRNLSRLLFACGIVLAVLMLSPIGERIVEYLPFVGTVAADNVTYRQRLLQVAIVVILQNPFFGAYDFMYSPAMEQLRQGQGIIDIVNTYIGVGLANGLTGLLLFAGALLSAGISALVTMKNLSSRNDDRYRLGQALVATLAGILVIIFTVSSITVIPVIYWSVAGMCVAYAQFLAASKAPEVIRFAKWRLAS